MSSRRMSPFLFTVIRRDGTIEDAIFYAYTRAEATLFARAWAQKAGHRRVELQDAEDAA